MTPQVSGGSPEEGEPPAVAESVDAAAPAESSPGGRRPVVIATVYGAVAGVVAALTFVLMHVLGDLLWSVSDDWWYVAAVITLGGLLIAALRAHVEVADLDAQIAAAADPVPVRRTKLLALAVSAILAVGFGGAIGPEAGLVAVVMELSAIVGVRIARSRAEEQLIRRAGTAAALAGLYASPPGGAAYDDDSLAPAKILNLLAAGSGFVAFAVTVSALGSGGGHVPMPDYRLGAAGDLLVALLPALVGALAGLALAWLRVPLTRLLARCGRVEIQTVVASLAFAALAAAWPILRFSGHESMGHLVDLAAAGAVGTLLALAVGKLLACAICVAGGWLGGEFFPLAFIGMAAGGATVAALSPLVPGVPLAVGLAAGLAAATAAGLGKPLAALVICPFIVQGQALGPLLVGALVAAVLLRVVPTPPPAHAAAHAATHASAGDTSASA